MIQVERLPQATCHQAVYEKYSETKKLGSLRQYYDDKQSHLVELIEDARATIEILELKINKWRRLLHHDELRDLKDVSAKRILESLIISSNKNEVIDDHTYNDEENAEIAGLISESDTSSDSSDSSDTSSDESD